MKPIQGLVDVATEPAALAALRRASAYAVDVNESPAEHVRELHSEPAAAERAHRGAARRSLA